MENSTISKETENFMRQEALAFSDFSEPVETINRKSVTDTDAVHRRFIKENPEELRKYEVENLYFCKQCNLFFAPTVIGLKSHFNKKRVEHGAYGSCLYCKGAVYDYSINNELRVYHNCNAEDSDSG